ncbi:MAG: hypothetical protein ACYSTS_16405 [Planctomycetota bacterium]
MNIFRFTVSITLLGLLGACQTTGTAQRTATSALAQIATYEREVGRKIKTENDYYEGAMDVATQDIVDLWNNEQAFKFEQEAKAFWEANKSTNVNQIGPKLVSHFNSTLKSWAKRDTDYEQLLTETRKTLVDNRKKLTIEMDKIKRLRTKLQALSEPRSNEEMLKLLVAFGRAAKEHYDELNKDSKAAEGTEAKGQKKQ